MSFAGTLIACGYIVDKRFLVEPSVFLRSGLGYVRCSGREFYHVADYMLVMVKRLSLSVIR